MMIGCAVDFQATGPVHDKIETPQDVRAGVILAGGELRAPVNHDLEGYPPELSS